MNARGNAEVAAVIESPIEAAEADDSLQCEPCGDDAASELFWESLIDHHDCEGKRLDGCESPQTRNVHSRGTKPDRRVRLGILTRHLYSLLFGVVRNGELLGAHA